MMKQAGEEAGSDLTRWVCARAFPRKREEGVAMPVPSGASGDVAANDSGLILHSV